MFDIEGQEAMYDGMLIDPTIVINGKNGKDGVDGKDGAPGPEGMPGRDGVDGRDGKDGKDGRDGVDGKDGISYWIEYDKKTNTLIFKNDGGKKSPDPIKLPPTAKGWGFAAGAGRGGGQVQADWNQTDKNNPTYIKNKPAVHNVRFLVVEELPTVGDPWTIYLVQESENQRGGSGGNIYSEWIFVENETTHTLSWEKFGTEVDLSGYMTDVKINNVSIVEDGVAKFNTSNSFGTAYSTALYVVRASDAEVSAKTNVYKPIVPKTIDLAVMEGLGNNSLPWTDDYKTSARNTIGAEAQATIQTLSATDSITLADNTIYNGGEQTALTIALPATVDVSFLCEIDFTSGATPATLSYPNTIKWAGDDVANNVFIPVASKRYTIICAYDGVNYRATVKGV